MVGADGDFEVEGLCHNLLCSNLHRDDTSPQHGCRNFHVAWATDINFKLHEAS